jgi:23S rRNA (uracil1939-C5)-methyltransferase
MQLKVERFAPTGESEVYLADGEICFIEGAIPGEIVEVEEIEEELDYKRGVIKEILNPVNTRISPRCSYFNLGCGGCQWQYINYSAQLEFKNQILKELLAKIIKGEINKVVLPPKNKEDKIWYYRNRAQLGVKFGKLGFHKRNSHYHIEIDHCFTLTPLLNEAISVIKTTLSPQILNYLHHLELRVNTSQEELLLIFASFKKYYNPKLEEEVEKLFSLIPYLKGIVILFGKGEKRVLGRSYLIEKINSLKLRVSFSSFFQANSNFIPDLIQTTISYLQPMNKDFVLDLYCGVGIFTLAIAEKVTYALGVEVSKPTIEDANYNAKLKGADNVKFILGTAEKFLRHHSHIAPSIAFNKVIINPPRDGCGKDTIKGIIKLAPERIVYISCNPVTLARDLSMLIEEGYKLIQITPFDLFPHTYHLESIALICS